MPKRQGKTPKKDRDRLTPQQEAFCAYFAIPDDQGRWRTATEAYRMAYPSCGASNATTAKSAFRVRWTPKVAARIDAIRADVRRDLEDRASGGIAIKAVRMIARQARWDALNDLIRARQSAAPGLRREIEDAENELANCDDERKREAIETRLRTLYSKIGIGEETGLLARDVKGVCDVAVDVWKFDKAVLDAMLDLEMATAKEMGEITERRDITSGGQPIEAARVVLYLPDNERDTGTGSVSAPAGTSG